MQCKDLMRRPVQIAREGDTVQSVARKMLEYNIGILPVCDKHGKTLGVITDRDLAVRVCADGLSARETLVSEVYTHKIVSCRESDDMEQVERLMSRHKTSRILVMDDADRLSGIVSLSDIAVRDGMHALETLRAVARREVLSERGAVH